jgi:hypothetical protein
MLHSATVSPTSFFDTLMKLGQTIDFSGFESVVTCYSLLLAIMPADIALL